MKGLNFPLLRCGAAAFLWSSIFILGMGFWAPAVAWQSIPSQTQLSSEAASYDKSIAEIRKVAGMSLSTMADLERANSICKQAAPGLKYLSSKLILLGLSDSIFLGGLQRQASDSQTAQALYRTLEDDLSPLFRMEGSEALSARLQRAIDEDVSILRQAADRFKEAAGRLQKAEMRPARSGSASSKMAFAFAGKGESAAILSLHTPTVQAGRIVTGSMSTTAIMGSRLRDIFVSNISAGRLTTVVRDHLKRLCEEAAASRYEACIAPKTILGVTVEPNSTETAKCLQDFFLAIAECRR